MGRPKGSKNKPKTNGGSSTAARIKIVRDDDAVETAPGETVSAWIDVNEPKDQGDDSPALGDKTSPAPEWDDLDKEAIEAAIRARDEQLLADVITDIQRKETEIENESAAVQSQYRKRLKTIVARRKDVIHELEEVTHEWVPDHVEGVARLINNRTGKVKMTRPLHPDDRQVEIPFGRDEADQPEA